MYQRLRYVVGLGLGIGCLWLLVGCGGSPTPSSSAGVGGTACSLQAGDLFFTEVFSDPVGPDRGKEWLELYNPTDKWLVLDRAVLEVTPLKPERVTKKHVQAGEVFTREAFSEEPRKRKTHVFKGAPPVPPHSYYLVGDGEVEEPLEFSTTTNLLYLDYSYGNSLNLVNLGARVSLSCLQTRISEVVYPATGEGKSYSLTGASLPSAELSKLADAWCITEPTPKQTNHPCFKAPCRLKKHQEAESGKEAEGEAESEAEWREIHSPKQHELLITEVFADPLGPDKNLEWLELLVVAQEPIDFNNLQITNTRYEDGASGKTRKWTVLSEDCVVGQPGAYVVIGFLSPTDETNLELKIPTTFDVFGGELYNFPSIFTLQMGEELIAKAVLPHPVAGASMMLSSDKLDDPLAPEDPHNFCVCPVPYEGSKFMQYGTPMAPNVLCP